MLKSEELIAELLDDDLQITDTETNIDRTEFCRFKV
ncbi:hypothetical protein BuS5_00961 [Desulfosarcina sp. BuS5]|nr:hypothetical protein BuS5_00961 [Desulfosarcina sp. BuS5]